MMRSPPTPLPRSISTSSRKRLSRNEEIKELSNFRFKKSIFLLANSICALLSFIIFSLSLYDLYRIQNHEPFPLKFPISLISIYASTSIVSLIGCLAACEKSVKIMRFFYFLMWIALITQIVFFMYFLMPMRECVGDFLVRRFRERIADIMIGSIVVAVMQVITLLTGIEFTLVLINEFHEAEMCTIKSLCGESEYTLDG